MNPPTALELATMELEKESRALNASNKKRTASSNSRKGKGKRKLLHSQTEGPPVHHGALRTKAHNYDIMFNAGHIAVAGEQRDLDEEGFDEHQTRTFD